MITIAALAKIIAIPIALLFLGMILLPDQTYFFVVGCVTGLIGLATLFFYPRAVLVLIPVGVGLVAMGIRVQRRAARALEEQREQLSHRVARTNELYLPPDHGHRR